MNKAELRARILATANPKPVLVKDLPEWGDVYVKPLLIGEIEALSEDADPKLKTARSIARVLCDQHGETLFDMNSTEDLFAINGLQASSLSKINEAMERVNGAEAKDAGNVLPPETASSLI